MTLQTLSLALDGAAAVTGELERVRRLLAGVLVQHQVDARATYACELVLEEWVTNVWRHGGLHADGGVATGVVAIECEVQPQQVRLQFRDEGIAFDPTTAAEPAPPSGLASARVGGLGLRMMRGVVHHWQYRREHGSNLLTAWIARQGHSPG